MGGRRACVAVVEELLGLGDIASTSAMFRPPVYSSTDAWNRFPSHSSQVDSTVAMTPRSV